jgi:heptosyltransferase-1
LDNKRLSRVLIIKPSSLGDIIHALPVASAIKAAYPEARIDWVAGKGYEEILAGNPDVDRVITFDRRMFDGDGKLNRLSAFVKELRRERYDAVIDLQGLLRSALMVLACRRGRSIGFENAREGARFFYTEKITVKDESMHAVERYLLVLDRLGIKRETAEAADFTMEIGLEDRERAGNLLKELGVEGREFIAVAPSARWETKRWPADNFIRLANLLLEETGLPCVFVGTDADAYIMGGSAEKLIPGNVAAFGRTSIMGLAALLKKASVMVTNDSGPMHIAAAVGTPTVALFGPTDPSRTGPYGEKHSVVRTGCDCQPCFRKSCETVKCLTGMSVADVYNAVREVLCR